TTGLHFDDIQKLLAVIQRLVDLGNSVVVIEHNLDVIKCADWVIDMGPEAGAEGGMVVVTGTPEEVAGYAEHARPSGKKRTAKKKAATTASKSAAKTPSPPRSHTGEHLADVL
ncbi:MAG: hypothetical protein AAFP90_05025, partial [Planctomycetota bacterium]